MDFMTRARRKSTRPPNRSSSPSIATAQSSPDDSWDELDLSSTDYARMRKELMQLINDLRSLGASPLIDLPTIVVIGGQSAGKSSLVEAVTGVNVPRDSGTCTRCPMECTMSSSATTWSCKIKLRFDYDSSGRSALSHKELAFGPVITDKNEMEIWLRRAQAAILNPDLPTESFQKKSIQDLKNFNSPNTLKFSQNVVSIFIEDPTATDVSFVDLPGLIQNEEKDILDLVQKLTESYISRQNAIILTTIPMSDDMQNQKSVRLAREADPEGERTIGILTKPDTLGDGAVNAKKTWLGVIEGREHPLKHGYYCVRLPDDAQRAQRLPRPALQQIAKEYFENTKPWNEVTDCKRFGIPSFVADISVLLVNHIKRNIPKLREEVERLLTACLEEISMLPKPLETDPHIEVLTRVNAFCEAFKGAVSGTSSNKDLVQRNRALYTKFNQEIGRTSPDFRPFEDPLKYQCIDVERTPLKDSCPLPPSPKLARRPPSPSLPVLGAPEGPADFVDVIDSEKARDTRVKTMGVYDVRKIIMGSIAWELPGNVPYEAKTRLINQFTTLWATPAEKCLTDINDVLDDVIEQLVEKHFSRFKVLHALISDLIRPDIQEHKNRTLDAVRETLRLETAPIYTQNLKDYEDLREKWFAQYRRARRTSEEYLIFKPREEKVHSSNRGTSREHPTSSEQEALMHLAQAGYKGVTVYDLARLDHRNGFEDELRIMADVRAYFTIAYRRVIDHISLKIEHSLHQALAERLSVSLLQRLLADTSSTDNFTDRMKELVAEDPAIEAKQSQLEALRSRLHKMRRKLLNFAM